ncbi:hypothetical protein KHS38_08565 [Mucilaginibacter sp. Bleaf8]|uniref:hypothetical protein n=1 Tax=Mucilaginibacter sp. Bleaf8 TaxID=2834430 RepID=UPI001BCF6ADA|nr:hypothetical protein [Mucilaginibacter sp. Bleaf8]MBS7564458.1 hypothetical protein [Mucilaginibacter sp. Bleaf8]
MKCAGRIIITGLVVLLLNACGENPHNTFGGPTEAKDTAASQRDTSSIGTRTERE